MVVRDVRGVIARFHDEHIIPANGSGSAGVNFSKPIFNRIVFDLLAPVVRVPSVVSVSSIRVPVINLSFPHGYLRPMEQRVIELIKAVDQLIVELLVKGGAISIEMLREVIQRLFHVVCLVRLPS